MKSNSHLVTVNMVRVGSVPRLSFVSDSQEVSRIKSSYPPQSNIHQYDSFFVNSDGDPVWAMVGIIPWLSKPCARVATIDDMEVITSQPT